ncbi:MAG: DivIVA domain-containing protein [Acutalibacteraceae bacterium]|nr:DivIVA domain-containing protein [Acutalibacteraceae bacterium]
MLTPAKIKNHHFEASGRNAYKADGVDRFFEEVADSYEQMFRENGEMYKKISLLAERLEEYRNDEDNIRNALLTAQRMAEQIQREAREKSDALVAEAQARAVAENARVDAQTTEMLTAATYQAQSIVAEANKQAAKIIDDATRESKEAAISARDWMIKEEAALEMMKIEVTKFKKQILDSYAQQLELIETLPEIVYAQIDAEKEAEAVAVIEEEPVVEEPVVEEAVVEEPVVEEAPAFAEEEVAAVAAFEAYEEGSVDEIPAEDEDSGVDVDTLQQMITETEDTDLDDEHIVYEEEVETFEEISDEELVIPEVDDGASADLDEIVDYFSDNNKGDVMFTKPEKTEKAGGFSLNVDKISAYDTKSDAEFEADEFDEEFDDDDNNDGDDLASKFKSFFKK